MYVCSKINLSFLFRRYVNVRFISKMKYNLLVDYFVSIYVEYKRI